jgi:hypothetical protein
MHQKLERGFRVKPAEIMALSALALLVLPSALHPQKTKRVFSLLLDRSPECANINESDRFNQDFDILVIPGAGNSKISNGKQVPNHDQKLRLEAAAYQFIKQSREGNPPQFIYSYEGPQTPGVNEYLSRNYFQEFVRKTTKGEMSVSNDLFIVENEAINTSETIRALSQVAGDGKFHSVGIFSQDYHLNRIKMLVCHFDNIEATVISVEEMMALNDQNQFVDIGKTNVTWKSVWKNMKEEAKLLTFVPGVFDDGAMLTWLKEINQPLP